MSHESVISANLTNFREFDENESPFAPLFSFVDGNWICGDTIGNVYRHSQESDRFEVVSEDVTDDSAPITSMATNPTDSSSILIAYNNLASLRNFPDVKEVAENMIVRRTLPITHMEYHKEGKHCLLSSEEPNLVVYSFNSDSIETTIKSDNVGIRTFGQSSTGDYVCAIDMNGSVFLYKLEYKKDPALGYSKCTRSEVDKKINGIVGRKSVRSVVSGCKVSWYPSTEGLTVAVPGTKGTPQLFVRPVGGGEWEEKYLVPQEEGELSHGQSDLTMVCFSPSGQHLASADVDGTILIWKFDHTDPETSAVVTKVTHTLSSEDEPLCDIAWGSDDDGLYLMILTKTQFTKVGRIVAEEGVAIDAKATLVDDFDDEDWAAIGEMADQNMMLAQQQQQAVLATQPDTMTETEGGLEAGIDIYSETTAADDGGEEMDNDAGDKSSNHVNNNNNNNNNDSDEEFDNTQPDTAFVASSSSITTTTSSPSSSSSSSSSSSNGSSSSSSSGTGSRLQKTAGALLSASTSTSEESSKSVSFADKPTAPSSSSAPPPPSSSSAAKESVEDIKRAKVGSAVLDDEDDDEDEEDDFIDDRDGDHTEALTYLDNQGLLRSPMAAITPLQKAFQPSSTTRDDQKRRYLVWNHIGSITSREEEIENKIVIRFTNVAGGNKGEAFTDNRGFTMAALSYEGAIFASDPEEEDSSSPNHGSNIYYHAFPGQKQVEGVNESFQYVLPNNEAALAVAVGKGWVAVATSKQLLRVYSSVGLQVSVTWLKGPVVSLVGGSDKLAVIYHGDSPLDETCRLKLDLFEIKWRAGCDGSVVVQDLAVPLTVKSTLTWAGFDCEASRRGGSSGGPLFVMDSEGMVSILLHQSLGWRWMPVLDTASHRKSIDHHFWPVMVKGSKFVYVSLNGEKRPAIYPQPLPSTKPFRVILTTQKESRAIAEADLEKAHQFLWGSARAAHLSHSKDALQSAGRENASLVDLEEMDTIEEQLAQQQKELDKAILQRLQEACQKQQIPLALNLCLKLQGEKEIEIAITVANHFGRSGVANTLDMILQRRREVDQYIADLNPNTGGSFYAEDSSGSGGGSGNGYDDEHEGSQRGDPDHDEQEEEEEAPYQYKQPTTTLSTAERSNSLTSKVGARNGNQIPVNPFSKRVVSPSNDDISKPVALNPFAVTSTGLTPLKRKDVFAGVQDMGASPSPAKKLNRQSTFAQQARTKKLKDKTLL